MNDLCTEQIRIPRANWDLAGLLTYDTATDGAAAALLLLPHPYMGGRMSNPVLEHIATTLAGAGRTVLRFDYRGVGDSGGPPVDIEASLQSFWRTGRAPEDPALIEDAHAALTWLREATDGARVTVVGYSFGAWAATHLPDSTLDRRILIAPTITRHAYPTLTCTTRPTLVIHGEGDFATPRQAVDAWLRQAGQDTTLITFPRADHFFRGIEPAVADACARFLLTNEAVA